ncbi:GAF domain-containing protein [Simiduia aestuariiviva]|uniref:GAF domain-containing protein n=1 Tax=Simiduia aestuariiviva TaxID=1510459 RepID=A0A839UNG5_9GAMM|nr:GAF domain-containing protein [Simiduia aestuariiviva]MBB3167286.1 GAF domain-containing protein [Simiduia aestuariiviva]
MNDSEKSAIYAQLLTNCRALTEGETDEIALMATLVCEIHQALPYSHWTGFYRVTEPQLLKVGPYQGGHGCLQIAFDRGVCGKAATDKTVQRVDDVNSLPYHIACSSSTLSEIVLPVLDQHGAVRAVLDLDSNDPAAFTEVDEQGLQALLALLAPAFQ